MAIYHRISSKFPLIYHTLRSRLHGIKRSKSNVSVRIYCYTYIIYIWNSVFVLVSEKRSKSQKSHRQWTERYSAQKRNAQRSAQPRSAWLAYRYHFPAPASISACATTNLTTARNKNKLFSVLGRDSFLLPKRHHTYRPSRAWCLSRNATQRNATQYYATQREFKRYVPVNTPNYFSLN